MSVTAGLTSPAISPVSARAGRFGAYGGRYVPETLMAALEELEQAYAQADADPAFHAELDGLLHHYCGRPTPLYFAKRLTETLGGAKIYLKREDLLHTGAHKINNALGQGLLARRMGKQRIIAETGAGQHGVATATVCALFGLECVIYMGEEDMRRQELNVFRMRLLGAEVRGVGAGSATLKDAINEAMRDWVTNVRDTYYILGSALGGASVPDHGAQLPSRHQPRGARTDAGAGGQAADGDRRLRGRRIECHRRVLRVPRRQGCAPGRRRGRRARHRAGRTCGALPEAQAAGCRACCRERTATCCRTTRARWRRPTR